MVRWRSRTSIVVLTGLLFLPACSEGGGSITVDGRTANDHPTEGVSGQASIEFEMDDFSFEPAVLEGGPGQSLTLEAFNEGEARHNVTITDQVTFHPAVRQRSTRSRTRERWCSSASTTPDRA